MAKLAIRAAVPGNAKESVRMVGQLNRHEGMAVGAITPGIVRIHGFGKGRSFYGLLLNGRCTGTGRCCGELVHWR